MKKGSTAWYNHMAQQLNTCSMTMMLERYNRLLTAAKKSQPRLDEWMADQYTRVWNADYWLNKPPRRPIIIASLHDAETIRAHATNHPLTTGGIDIIPFPHMEDGKMIFHMADGSMLNAWPDCKNFADLPIAMSKTRIMDREEFRREYPHESAWKTPAPGTIKTAEENRVKRQSDAYMKMMSLLSGNIPAEQKTFEDKVYYIGKYRRFIQVKSRDQDNLICGGLTQYLDDSKTDISRQKISIKKFQDLSPIELDETKLHMYGSFMVGKKVEEDSSDITWHVINPDDKHIWYMDEAEKLPDMPSYGGSLLHRHWPGI